MHAPVNTVATTGIQDSNLGGENRLQGEEGGEGTAWGDGQSKEEAVRDVSGKRNGR
jgi:hypothetical protein